MGSSKKRPNRADVAGMYPMTPVVFSPVVQRWVAVYPNRGHVYVHPATGCHIWPNALRAGYGAVKVGGKVRGAHVLSWESANGRRMRKGRVVCHSCDVRCCVNPEHLSNGSYRENTLDAIAKGRAKNPPNRWELARQRAKEAA